MSRLGQFSPLDKTLHPSKIALAETLRELVRLRGVPCKALAKELCLSATLLSKWLGGKQIPPSDHLRNLWAAVQTIGADPQITWGGLLALRSHASEHHCPCCIANQPQHQFDEPASAPIPASETPVQALDTALPVPNGLGDRQYETQLSDGLGADNDLISRLRSSRQADVRLLLEKAGRTLPVKEIPKIVDALRGQEQAEAAEVVLHHAGLRQKREVCELALLLNSRQRHGDLNLLLKSATFAD